MLLWIEAIFIRAVSIGLDEARQKPAVVAAARIWITLKPFSRRSPWPG
jgi:hypothetical protein